MCLTDEKDIVNLYCMDYFYSEQMAAMKAPEFKRQQSQLWIDLHPEPVSLYNILLSMIFSTCVKFFRIV